MENSADQKVAATAYFWTIGIRMIATAVSSRGADQSARHFTKPGVLAVAGHALGLRSRPHRTPCVQRWCHSPRASTARRRGPPLPALHESGGGTEHVGISQNRVLNLSAKGAGGAAPCAKPSLNPWQLRARHFTKPARSGRDRRGTSQTLDGDPPAALHKTAGDW